MSSWKKASKTGQRYHRERGQLKERESIGFLEKKKDYKLRALDFQKKRDLVKNVKRQIQERNPDEFYFNMVNTEVKDGMHQLKKKYQDFNEDEIKLMKTQDRNYIRLHQQMERKKIEKLKSSLHLIDVEDLPQSNHRFFVDDYDEGKEFNPAKKLNTHESLLSRKSNRLTLEQLEKLDVPEWVDEEYLKAMSKGRVKAYKELNTRLLREKSLRKLEENYDLTTPKSDPEKEYDEKYHVHNDGDNAKVVSKEYKKVVTRKR